MFDNMTMGNAVTATTGLLVLLSVFLIRVIGDGFLILPVLIGIIVIQSAFTGFCPMTMLFQKLNLFQDKK